MAGSGLRLDLVYNPGGAFLPPPQVGPIRVLNGKPTLTTNDAHTTLTPICITHARAHWPELATHTHTPTQTHIQRPPHVTPLHPEERGWRKAGAENVTQRSAAKLQLKPASRSKPVTLAMQHELVNHALPSPASAPRPHTPCRPSPPQDTLHAAYTRELKEAFGITFNELFTITNMPIKRFADLLYKQGAPQEIIASLQRRRAEPTQPGPSSRPIPPRRRASEATRTLPGKRGAVPHESCMRRLLPV